MTDEDLKNYILIHKQEYEKLIEYRTKAEQYKKYILENTSNNNLTKAMITIERKSLYDLIKEGESNDNK